MIDFSIQALTTPFIPITSRCFDKITQYVVEKHPGSFPPVVNHDLKVLMFNAVTSLMVSTIAMAYFKMMALVTAIALAALFYLVRRIIAETFVPVEIPKKPSSFLNDIKQLSLPFLSHAPVRTTPQKKSMREKVKETFYQGDDIVIGRLVLLKMTHHPLPKVIGMVFTRSS